MSHDAKAARHADIVVDSQSPAPCTAMRSTVLIGLRAAYRDAGIFDAYERHLDPAVAAELTTMVAGAWVPLPIVHAHYEASDALGLTVQEQTALGAAAGVRINPALVGTALKLAATAGTTPWGFMQQVGRYWNRPYAGSGLRIVKRGPKEAAAEVLENSIHQRSPFARYSFCGVCAEMFRPFCRRFFMKVDAVVEHPERMVRYIAQWV